MKLEKFKITKLFNDQDFELKFKDCILIIVAGNGSGKTVLLRLIYFFLTKQWTRLIEYNFEVIEATINGKDYIFRKGALNNTAYFATLENLANRYPIYERFISNTLSKFNINELKSNSFLINDLETEFDIPLSLLTRMVNELTDSEFDSNKYDWEFNILYLPTYRRIEKDINQLFGDMDKRFEQYIKVLIPEIEEKIREEKRLAEEQTSVTENDLQHFFTEIWKARDQERWKKKGEIFSHIELLEFGMNDVIFKVREFVNSSVEEKKYQTIDEFLICCNKYFDEKKLRYDRQSNSLFMELGEESVHIELNDLSSGEKQLISLFCHLYVEDQRPFVIIDEPELSLSIRWQESLLTDILNSKCTGLLAATHSPFLITEAIKPYTFGLNQFVL